MYFVIFRLKVGRIVRILMGCCFSMRPWLKTGGYRTFLSERGWGRGDFKVSIDSEFVFHNRNVFESKQEIDALNDRPGFLFRTLSYEACADKETIG